MNCIYSRDVADKYEDSKSRKILSQILVKSIN